MVDVVNDRQKVGPQATAAARRRRVAVAILILIVDVGYIAWGAVAAAFAGSSARSRGQSDPAGRLGELFRRVVVRAGRDLPADRGS